MIRCRQKAYAFASLYTGPAEATPHVVAPVVAGALDSPRASHRHKEAARTDLIRVCPMVWTARGNSGIALFPGELKTGSDNH